MRNRICLKSAVLILAVGGCGAPAKPTQGLESNGASQPIAYFEGTIDVASGAMEVHSTPPPEVPGVNQRAATLPYGTGADQVHFHTCPGTVNYNLGTHQLTGTVQAVNNLSSGTVQMMNAVIDSVSPVGVTPASGVIAAYGTVPSGVGATCGANTATWTFTDPTDANLTFTGHADGITCTPVPACDVQGENGTVTLTCPAGRTIQAITYASYGTPTGSCPGPFTNSSCHSATSLSEVQTRCLGMASCMVPATNAVFGDPCFGTVKRLAVTASCCP